MKFDLEGRKQTRLAAFDYTSCGAYFVTVCIHNRREILSSIRRGDPCGRPQIQLSHLGQIAARTFGIISEKYGVVFDTWIVMPDYIHFVVMIPERAVENVPLSQIVGGYKSMVTKAWLDVCNARGWTMGKLWQRNYYEHVIRNDQDLDEIRLYIAGNPGRWIERHQQLNR